MPGDFAESWRGAMSNNKASFVSVYFWCILFEIIWFEELLFLTKSTCKHSTGFLRLGTIRILDWIIPYCGGGERPVPCRTLHSIPGLYPLDARSATPKGRGYKSPLIEKPPVCAQNSLGFLGFLFIYLSICFNLFLVPSALKVTQVLLSLHF